MRSFPVRALLVLYLTAIISYGAIARPPFGYGGGTVSAPAANQLTALLGATCLNCWNRADNQVATNATMASVGYTCTTSGTACGFPSTAPLSNDSNYAGSNSFRAEQMAWAGGVYDNRDDWMLIDGSGHDNYAGNEIYAFENSILQWARLFVPNPAQKASAGNTCNVQTGAGVPSPVHTYSAPIWMSSVNLYLKTPNGCVEQHAFTVDPAIQSASAFALWTQKDAPAATMGFGEQGVWDPTNNVAMFMTCPQCLGNSSFGLFKFNPSASPGSQWTTFGTYASQAFNRTASFDPIHRLIVSYGVQSSINCPGNCGTSRGDIYNPDTSTLAGGCNISSGSAVSTSCWVASSGATNCDGTSGPGLDWDGAISKFILWCGGSALYTMDATTNPPTVTALTISGSNIVTPTCNDTGAQCWNGSAAANSGLYEQNGTYGRMRVIPAAKYGTTVIELVNGPDAPTYFFKCGAQC